MKKIIFIALSLLIAIFVFGQKNNPRKYFESVNKAELAIIDSNYTKAISYYKQAFKWLKEPFGRDLHNAVCCGFFTNDSSILSICYPKFIERKYIDKYSSMFENSKLILYWKFLMQDSSIKSTIDTNFVNLISELEILDQKYRWKDDNKDLGVAQDSINMQRLIEYMDNNNVFLSEEKVSNAGTKNFISTNSITGYILLLHYAQDAHAKINPVNLNLKEKVLEGIFDPQFYAHLCDHRGYGLDGRKIKKDYNYNIYGVCTYLSKNTNSLILHYPKLSKEDLKRINKNRKEIYLCSYSDFLKKMEFERKRIESYEICGKGFDYIPFRILFPWFTAIRSN